MSFENKYYQEATKYIESSYRFFDSTINVGYNKDDTTQKNDRIMILQNNTIIAMITQLQNKIDSIQNKMFDIDKTGKDQEYEINKLTESLQKLNLGPSDPTTTIISKKSKMNFLMYKQLDKDKI